MKTLVTIILAALFSSCSGEMVEKRQPKEKKQLVAPPQVAVLKKHTLLPEQSEITWQRELDQKPTEQNLKVLGGKMKLNLGNVKMSSSGTVQAKTGLLEVMDGKLDRATVNFNMVTFKLAEQKGEGLFDVKKYPEGRLEMNNFRKDTSGFVADGNLTLQDKTNAVKVKLFKAQMEEGKVLKGQFVFQTLDFPLREQVKAKDVNKDEITVDFKLVYQK